MRSNALACGCLVLLLVIPRSVEANRAGDVISQHRELLERIAKGGVISDEERTWLRSLIHSRFEDGALSLMATWALTKVGDKGALPLMARKRRDECRDRTRCEYFQQFVWDAYLRLAPLRLTKRTRRQAQSLWWRLLRSDRNQFMRAEATKELVAVGHPKALELLRRVLEEARRSTRPRSYSDLLSQTAFALGGLGRREAIPNLESLLGKHWEVNLGYAWILELEQCQTLWRQPCNDTLHYLTVDGYARRALEQLTAERWPLGRSPATRPGPRPK